MNMFRRGQAHIMVATTVIEVGVDIPNASVMVVESAERFGLSQLHQLRGRVGRGADQSYCILMTSHKLSADATERINTMISTVDGFEIAEADLVVIAADVKVDLSRFAGKKIYETSSNPAIKDGAGVITAALNS